MGFIDYAILLSEVISGIMLVIFVQEMPTRFWKICFWYMIGVLLYMAFMVSPMCLILVGSFVIFLAEMMRRRSKHPPWVQTLAKLLPGGRTGDGHEQKRMLDDSMKAFRGFQG